MKTAEIDVLLLSGAQVTFPASSSTYGEDLFKRVTEHLSLNETDYFGLKWTNQEGLNCWLVPDKTLKEQSLSLKQRLHFAIKFYPSDPGQVLLEELTRYLFTLSFKHELHHGLVPCNETMKAFLASCLVQSEFGDFDEDDEKCQGVGYIEELLVLPPGTDMSLLDQVKKYHRQRIGQRPFESDHALLEKAKQIETYGATLIECRDNHQVPCRMSPSSRGILVFQQQSLVQTWDWSVIRKISFKQREFLIKLRRADGTPSDTKHFHFRSRNAAKGFWKYAIENHGFFHLKTSSPVKKKPMLVSKGSQFRYAGKTQEELNSSITPTKEQRYERKTSIRKPKTMAKDKEDYKQLHSQSDQQPQATPNDNDSQPSSPSPLASPIPPPDPNHVPTSMINSIIKDAEQIHQNVTHELKPEPQEDSDTIYDEPRKLRQDFNYSVCKEICMTERTHLHDLEVIVVHLRNALKEESGIPEPVLTILYSLYDPIYAFHKDFLTVLEARVAEWSHEQGSRIGELLAAQMKKFVQFEAYFVKIESIMREIESALQSYPRFLQAWRSFDQRKLCYLPLTAFFIKPIARLFHYYRAIERMEKREGFAALQELAGPVRNLKPVLIKCLQFQIQAQLQRELIGADRLIRQGREFIREGYLRKWAGPHGGFNARMFFLFNDCLLWTTSKIEPPTTGNAVTKPWKLSIELPLNQVTVELSDMERSAPHSFAINLPDPKVANDNKVTSLILSSSTAAQRNKWVSDIELAANRIKQSDEPFYSAVNGTASSSYHLSNISPGDDDVMSGEAKVKQNTTSQVCWFRYCTLSFDDHLNMSQNVMSGYLMRKFKNKPVVNNSDQAKSQQRNWQKLWVVLNNFSIYFYKRHQESAPLAHLPLLEYSVKVVEPESIPNCKHQFVFMIKLKKHEYYFAAETEYFFTRWMETLRTATLCNE